MTALTPDDDETALASTAGALHRIAGFITGRARSEALELRDDAIRLAGERLSAHRLADAAGIPFELVMAVLCA